MLDIFNCEFKENKAHIGGALFFNSTFPYESLENTGNKFTKNYALIFGNDKASHPFRFVFATRSENMFDIRNVLNDLNLLKIKPGRRFNIDFELYSIDQFDQNSISLIKNEFYFFQLII